MIIFCCLKHTETLYLLLVSILIHCKLISLNADVIGIILSTCLLHNPFNRSLNCNTEMHKGEDQSAEVVRKAIPSRLSHTIVFECKYSTI